MKNIFQLLLSVTSIAIVVLFTNCEGPAGPPGANGSNGINGADGTSKCMACHNEKTDFAAKQAQFMVSGHALGTYHDRTGDCSGCHSTEGFLGRKDLTSVSEMGTLGQPMQTAIGCKTCHTVHMAYDSTDWSMTYADVVAETIFGTKSANYESTSFGDYTSANLCLQCHQARDAGSVPSITSTDSVTLNKRWGPHHGPQGSVLYGAAAVNVPGDEAYPEVPNGHGKLLSKSCIDCHMAGGDHTLTVSMDACKTCHDDAKGDTEELQAEVKGLLSDLGSALVSKGVMAAIMEEGEVVGYEPKGVKAEATLARAVYNYMLISEDRSYGVHNPSFTTALLKNTLASVQVSN